ncbi:MAG TPA: hypothetical protein VFS24_20325 [Steroidobacteraceae bacterium]|nr:hypothetical protein [Steroidobacteraceae bacterium]
MWRSASVVLAAISLCACASEPEEVTANLKIATDEAQVSRCDYVGTFKMNFKEDGIDQSLASYKDRMRSNKEFRRAASKGANVILRVDPNPAPLVPVKAYSCDPGELAPHRF